MNTINVAYYAKLREERGLPEECLESEAATPAILYEELRKAYGFSLTKIQLRVVVNEAFVSWETSLNGGDTVVFIPPVAGG